MDENVHFYLQPLANLLEDLFDSASNLPELICMEKIEDYFNVKR